MGTMHTIRMTTTRRHRPVTRRALFPALAAVLLLVALAGGGTLLPAPVAAAAVGPDMVVICRLPEGCMPVPLPAPAATPAPRNLSPRAAATFTVTATGEPAVGTDATCAATCTLRQAVNASNANNPGAGTNTITFDPATFGTAQTITLSSAAGFGTLTLTQPVTITGPGANLLTIDGGCTDCGVGKANTSGTGVSVFAIISVIAVGFSGLTVANGDTPGNFGGAINNAGGTVTVTNCAFTNNHAAIIGGALANDNGTLTVTGSTFTGNIAGSFAGGAILSIGTVSPATLTITGSTFTGNQAPQGGAINNNQASTATITGSTFTGNNASAVGSAILEISGNTGGLTLVNSTVSGNTSSGSGGTVVSAGLATTAIAGSTISGNSTTTNNGTGGVYAFLGGIVTLTDTISAGNTDTGTGGSPDLFSTTANTPFTGMNNIIGVGDGTNFTGLTNGVNGNQTGTTAAPLNPQIGPLASNGGPVQTRALLPGSPAIDTGTCAYTSATGAAQTLTTDARRVPRPQGTACDIGAYEVVASPQTLVVTRAADDVNDPNCATVANGGCTLRQAVNLSNLTTGAATNTITFDPATFGSAQTIPLTVASGPLTPTHPVTITGPGANLLTVDAGCTNCAPGGTPTTGTKHFLFQQGGSYTISGMTLQHGNGNAAGSGSGGAVDVLTASANTVTLTGMVFRENASGYNGGAVSVQGGGNAVRTLNIAGSTFIGNTGANGGGAIITFDVSDVMQVTNSTFTGNAAPNSGVNAGVGGAIDTANGGSLTVTGSTISGNTASGGGGIRAGGTFTLALSVVAGNTATGGVGPDIKGTVSTDGGGNVVGNTNGSSGLTALSDRLGTAAAPLNPLLGSLALNAPGTVPTFGLLPGSPALTIAPCPIDPLTNATLATDARGVLRAPYTIAGRCDAGAFASRGFTISNPMGGGQSALVNTQFAAPVGLTITSVDNVPVTGGLVTFSVVALQGATGVFTPPGSCTLTVTTIAVCPVTMSGSVVSPTFTGNAVPGMFTIIAVANGAPTTPFTETITGAAPAAMNDGPFTVTTGTTLTVNAATGVLANDTPGNPVATLAVAMQPAHGMLMLNTTDGSFVYTPTAGYVGADSFTYTLTNAVNRSTGTVSVNVIASVVTGLTVTGPPTGTGGNTGTPGAPTLLLGGKLALTTTATYNNMTTGTPTPLMYTSSNPGVATVDPATGLVTALTAGTTTITVTGPNGSRTTLTLTVTGAAGTGLMPLPQPMAHGAAATVTAIPVTQPAAHPAGNGTGSNGVQPQAAGVPTAMPNVQPGRH